MMMVEVIAALEDRGYRQEDYDHFDMAFIRNVIFREKTDKGSYVDPPKPKQENQRDPDDDLKLMMRKRNWPEWLIDKEIRLRRGKKK